MPVDRVDTPESLSSALVRYARSAQPRIVADFCVGGGELLLAGQEVWPKAVLVGTDNDVGAVRSLKRDQPTWRVGRCDFVRAQSRASCKALRSIVGRVDVILLNPPFSCRGASVRQISLPDGEPIRCSVAMSFLLSALPFMSQQGLALAIMPAGSLTSEKDVDAWAWIKRRYSVSCVRDNGFKTFPGYTLRSVVVRIRPLSRRRRVEASRSEDPRSGVWPEVGPVGIVRGVIDAYTGRSRSARAYPLIHTTEMRHGRVVLPSGRILTEKRTVAGPAVLLPRVCEPSLHKVCLWPRGTIAISNCVMAMTCRSQRKARLLVRRIRANWDLLRSQYGGTCARYLTVHRLQRFLTGLGVRVSE